MYLESVKISGVDPPGDLSFFHNPMYHLRNCVDEGFVAVALFSVTTLFGPAAPFSAASPFGGVAKDVGVVMKGFVLWRIRHGAENTLKGRKVLQCCLASYSYG